MTSTAIQQPPGGLSKTAAWTLALGATLTMAVSYFDRQTFAVLAPVVTKELSISAREYGLLGSAFSLAYLVGSPLSGKIVDRYGARRVLLGAVIAWSIVAAFHSVAWSFGSLFVLRILLGLTESPSFPGATQTVHRALPPADRARGFGILFTGSSIGAMIAPIAASSIEKHYGFRSAFFVTAVAGLVWIPMWLFITRGAARRAVLDHAAPGVTSNEPAPSLWATVRHKAVLRACIVVLTSAPLAAFVLLWSAKYLHEAEGIAQADMGKYLWLPPVLFDIGSVGFGHLASKKLAKTREIPGPLFFACGLLASIMPIVLFVPGPWVIMACGGVALAGVAGLFALFTTDMLARVPANAVSTAGGVAAAAQSLAYIVVNPLIGEVVDATKSYTIPIIALSAVVLPGVIAFLLWKPPPLREG